MRSRTFTNELETLKEGCQPAGQGTYHRIGRLDQIQWLEIAKISRKSSRVAGLYTVIQQNNNVIFRIREENELGMSVSYDGGDIQLLHQTLIILPLCLSLTLPCTYSCVRTPQA